MVSEREREREREREKDAENIYRAGSQNTTHVFEIKLIL
jgi:hypothetical protein